MLEKIYEEYKERLSKSDHKILDICWSMSKNFRLLLQKTSHEG